jgi:hypothetical protein
VGLVEGERDEEAELERAPAWTDIFGPCPPTGSSAVLMTALLLCSSKHNPSSLARLLARGSVTEGHELGTTLQKKKISKNMICRRLSPAEAEKADQSALRRSMLSGNAYRTLSASFSVSSPSRLGSRYLLGICKVMDT